MNALQCFAIGVIKLISDGTLAAAIQRLARLPRLVFD
ncbi:hypothetical protein Thiofri_00889 [Thiorhodovibrio frisius]|nr:hypothetical protein Thiofri_00889 [Thiorhodovibrio frisius]